MEEDIKEYNKSLFDSANLHDHHPSLGLYFEMLRGRPDYKKGEVRMRCKDIECPRSTVVEIKKGTVVQREPKGRGKRKKSHWTRN